jgi:hypothetical protein
LVLFVLPAGVNAPPEPRRTSEIIVGFVAMTIAGALAGGIGGFAGSKSKSSQ